MRGRPNRQSLLTRLTDVTPGDDGPTSVTITHVHVGLPDAATVDPDDAGPRPDVDTTPEIRGVTRRIEAERDGGEWTGDTVVADDLVDLSDDGGDGFE